MKGIILLNSNENTKRIEEEEKSRFVREILLELGLPIEKIWEADDDLSIESRIKLRGMLLSYNIQIIDSLDGEIQIYHENELIGEWKKCQYVLKKDISQRDPLKKLYLEMHIDNWTIFENA